MDFYELDALKRGFHAIAGVDEAGRGPLAGPVLAACVMFPVGCPEKFKKILEIGINDSKKLSPLKREILCSKIFETACSVGIGIAWPDCIEQENINVATHEAMVKAVSKLMPRPDFLLIDGVFTIPCNIKQVSIIGGDAKSVSVAAASIIAKVARDRIMSGYHNLLPDYRFAKHKGYGTREHIESIKKYGPSLIHRRGFKGVKEYICRTNGLD